MSIVIYTYCDPYRLDEETFWTEIKNCPYFCSSQTLVNGLNRFYNKRIAQGHATTVQNLVEALFDEWESQAGKIKQHAAIDNIISTGVFDDFDDQMKENIVRTFSLNREEVFKSIRVLFELNINPDDIISSKLTPEQLFIVELYKKIRTDDKDSFVLKDGFSESELDRILNETMEHASNKPLNYENISTDRIVIHGVHQFSPIILRAIEEIAKYKKVILLFNYQPQYKDVYKTWINVYSEFNCPMYDSIVSEFRPSEENRVSYNGNVLADNLGKMINGETENLILDNHYEITEFDNMTEFANYVAQIFDNAVKADPLNPMEKMSEQVYAADYSANDILKIYFPDQFGERSFLNYPLGHFFVSIANMWDPETNELVISDLNDIKECLNAGILEKENLGHLSSIWEKFSALFDGCESIGQIKERLKNTMDMLSYSKSEEFEYFSHISYYTVAKEEIDRLERALSDLEKIACYFYKDFEKQEHNFREFYSHLQTYLQQEVLNEQDDIEAEFADIVRRVLDQLEEVKDIEASASFDCLKSTMSLYLTQRAVKGKSANWIVRPFEQIEGDILRSNCRQNTEKPMVFHFACLSDEDIHSVHTPVFPWPLTDDFFEIAQDPVDWKNHVYIRSQKEYKNFKRFALIYGLEFNRGDFKLSYIKRGKKNDREPYYLLKILGIEEKQFKENRIGKSDQTPADIILSGDSAKKYSIYDCYRYELCQYKFLLESIVENNTIYKDSFLLERYYEVVIENILEEPTIFKGSSFLDSQTIDTYEAWSDVFPFVSGGDKIDIINAVKIFMDRKKKSEADPMTREIFLRDRIYNQKTRAREELVEKFSDLPEDQALQELSESLSQNMKFQPNINAWCQYCSNREICLAPYGLSS